MENLTQNIYSKNLYEQYPEIFKIPSWTKNSECPYYPLDWNMEKWSQRLARAVFIASHQRLENKENLLRRVVLPKQTI